MEKYLGIDPGSRVCGWGLVEKNGNKISFIEAGIIDMRHIADTHEKIVKLYDDIQWVIQEFQPTAAAIETPFFHKNAQTLIKLSQARASAVLAICKSSIPLAEFSPLEVKKTLTGRGRADKSQVAYMVSKVLAYDVSSFKDDATDALAIAICRGLKARGSEESNKSLKKNSWGSYIKENPTKIRQG